MISLHAKHGLDFTELSAFSLLIAPTHSFHGPSAKNIQMESGGISSAMNNASSEENTDLSDKTQYEVMSPKAIWEKS